MKAKLLEAYEEEATMTAGRVEELQHELEEMEAKHKEALQAANDAMARAEAVASEASATSRQQSEAHELLERRHQVVPACPPASLPASACFRRCGCAGAEAG